MELLELLCQGLLYIGHLALLLGGLFLCITLLFFVPFYRR